MKSTEKFVLVLVASLGLLLAGCGGGTTTLVDDPKATANDERQREADVGAARMKAHQSYMDANGSATSAEAAADAAEVAAPGSTGAMAARTAATAARMAADAAKAAHDAITDSMTKAEADEQAATAATAAMTAKSHHMTAMRENNTIQTAAAAAGEVRRMSDVADAKEAAAAAVMAAMTAKDAANTAATAAETARDAARAAYMRAMAARTDSEAARTEYEEASAAATAARNAANDANTAYMAAKMAHDGIDDAGTADAAEMAQMTAETEQGKAKTAQGTAESQQMMAETDRDMAMAAADTHVLGLLKAANAVDVEDVANTEANEQAAVVMAVATAIGTAAGEADNGSTSTTATAMWPADIAATDDAEAMPGMLSITVTPEGATALTFRTEAVEDDPDTGADESAPKTATMIDGLGDFMHGYSISDGTTHAIVFTDKQQGTPAVAAVTAVTARELVNAVTGTTNTVTDLGTRSGTGYTGVTFYEGTTTTDEDTAFMGTLTCPSGTACTATVNADGTISVEGYVFTGSRAARAAVEEATVAENGEYLAFGVWLQEDENNDSTTDDPDVGAFADGGSTAPVAVEITGMATYQGSATGVYTAGSSVDYFQGDAELNANFGDDTAGGTITGRIDSIVAGGESMSDVIHLNSGSISGAGAITGGNARMGTATVVDAAATYPYNGMWSGQFYNGTADDTGTADVNESYVAPGSVAGTFGVSGMMGEGDDAVTRSYLGAFGAHLKE